MKESVERRESRPRPTGSKHQQPNRNPCKQREVVIRKRKREGRAATESEQHSRVPAEIHSTFDDSFETLVVKLAFGGLGFRLVGVGTHLHAVKAVVRGRHN